MLDNIPSRAAAVEKSVKRRRAWGQRVCLIKETKIDRAWGDKSQSAARGFKLQREIEGRSTEPD